MFYSVNVQLHALPAGFDYDEIMTNGSGEMQLRFYSHELPQLTYHEHYVVIHIVWDGSPVDYIITASAIHAIGIMDLQEDAA